MTKYLAEITVLLAVAVPAYGGLVFPTNSDWKFFKGFSEASIPDPTAWRAISFDDSGWDSGIAPLYYGEPLSGTLLSDMRGNYTCVFLRKKFELTNVSGINELQFDVRSDDGCIVWINGVEVARFNVPDGEIPFNGTASPALSEPIQFETYTLSNPRRYLVAGVNVIAIQALNASLSGSSDLVIDASLSSSVDDVPPVVANLYPAATSRVRSLTEIEVHFSEDVTGVDASDLLINGVAATNVTAFAPEQYVFEFAQPATGQVQVAWISSHDIFDLAPAPNKFGGGTWQYILDPDAPYLGVTINEFMADNDNTINDEDGDNSDWIEIYNSDVSQANLRGWYLTDSTNNLAMWRFPSVTLQGNSYLLVFASGKNRTNPAAPLHTNFKLDRNGEYLALVRPDGATIASEFAPQFPTQYRDVSYGRERTDPIKLGYFPQPTPGGPNSSGGPGFAPAVEFSQAVGTFIGLINLVLSADSTNAVIRYTLNGSMPNETSPVFSNSIQIMNTTQVRARAFEPGMLPGPPRSECYVALSSSLLNVKSDLPIVLIDNFSGGSVPANSDQLAYVAIFEPVAGVSSIIAPPDLSTRAGINIRGSSTLGLSKKSFAVEWWDEFNDDKRLETAGMPSESDWILYAPNNFEPVLIHNPFIFKVSNEIGSYAPRTRFVEVYLNTGGGALTSSHYNGVYVLMEKIKRGKNRVDIDKLEPEHNAAPEVTGGYMMKIDRLDPGDSGFSAAGQRIGYVDPKEVEIGLPQRAPQRQYIRDYMNEFGNALNSANYADPTIGYAKYVDVDSWIDHHILNVMAFNVDAFRLSAFFYKPRNGKLGFGPLWDFDRALASTDGRDSNPRVWRAQSGDLGTDFFNYPWWGRMFQDPNFWQRWIDRWQELRRDKFSINNLNSIIDAMANELRLAQVREVARWGGLTSPRYGSYQGDVNHMKQWLADRINFIDTNFLAAPVLSSKGGYINPGFELTMTGAQGTTVYYTMDGSDPRLPGGSVSPKAIIYGGTITLSNTTMVITRAHNIFHRNLTGPNNPPISSPWSGPVKARFTTNRQASAGALVITEINYNPIAPSAAELAIDAAFNNDDFEFIELKNISSETLDLFDVQFTKGIEFSFTNSSIQTLGAGESVLLVKNLPAFKARYGEQQNIAGVYTGNLDNAGETVQMEGTTGRVIQEVEYKDNWYPVTDGHGYSLVVQNEANATSMSNSKLGWRPSANLHGSPGSGDPAPNPMPQVVVNEALTYTPAPQKDAIELHNPAAAPADVSGWFITDNKGVPWKFRIPNGTVIPGFGYVVFDEDDFNADPNSTNSFVLNSMGDEVYLFSATAEGELAWHSHGFSFGPAEQGLTFGRHVSGLGNEQFVLQREPTLGKANTGPKTGPIVISEIMYRPPGIRVGTSIIDNTDDEYIELHNITDNPVLLYNPANPANTWRIKDAASFTFPTNVIVPAGGYVVIVSFDPIARAQTLAMFSSKYSLSTNALVFGPFEGKLSNSSDSVELARPGNIVLPPDPDAGKTPYILMDKVRYSNSTPWPVTADGRGYSLHRVNNESFGNDSLNWIAGIPNPGAQYNGDGPPVISVQPLYAAVNAGQPVEFIATASGSPPLSFKWYFNKMIIPGATGTNLIINGAQSKDKGVYNLFVTDAVGSAISSDAVLAIVADADEDGMPDDWEIENGLDFQDSSDAALDADADGLSNYDEFIAGTNPRDPLSYLKVDQISWDDNNVIIQFLAQANKSYSVIYRTSTDNGQWIKLTDVLKGTTNRLETVIDDKPGSATRYYRLVTPKL